MHRGKQRSSKRKWYGFVNWYYVNRLSFTYSNSLQSLNTCNYTLTTELHFLSVKIFKLEVTKEVLLTLNFVIHGRTCWNETRFGSDPSTTKNNNYLKLRQSYLNTTSVASPEDRGNVISVFHETAMQFWYDSFNESNANRHSKHRVKLIFLFAITFPSVLCRVTVAFNFHTLS